MNIRTTLILLILTLLPIFCRSDADVEDFDEVDYETPAYKAPPPAERSFFSMFDLSRLHNEDFTNEIAIIVFLIGYYMFYRVGSSKNYVTVQKWLHATKPVWMKNFSRVGVEENSILIRDSAKDFIFFASGRKGVRAVYGFVDTTTRHDLISYVLDFFTSTRLKKDTVTLTAEFDQATVDPFIFSMVSKRILHTHQKRYDISKFTSTFKNYSEQLKQKYAVLTDNNEFADVVMKDAVIEKYLHSFTQADGSNLFLNLVYTDQLEEEPETIDGIKKQFKLASIKFNLPSNLDSQEAQESMSNMVELFLDFIDYVNQIKVTSTTKAKIEKLREAAQSQFTKKTQLEKQEEIQKKKYQEKKKREEGIMKLPPDQQRKAEEKDRKREIKKAQQKAMKKGKLVV